MSYIDLKKSESIQKQFLYTNRFMKNIYTFHLEYIEQRTAEFNMIMIILILFYSVLSIICVNL